MKTDLNPDLPGEISVKECAASSTQTLDTIQGVQPKSIEKISSQSLDTKLTGFFLKSLKILPEICHKICLFVFLIWMTFRKNVINLKILLKL